MSVPGASKVVRLDEDGVVLSEFDVDIPAWDLTWDRDRQRLLTVNPGRSELRAYTRAGTLDMSLTHDFSDDFDQMASMGFSGVSWYEEDNKVFLVTTSGILFNGTTGSFDDPIPTSPQGEALGMDYAENRDELYVLTDGGYYYRFETDDFDDADLVSLWPAILSDPSFTPSGLAYDSSADEILIADRSRPIVSRFSRSGNFLGFQDYTSQVGSITGPVIGFDLIDTPSGVCFRTPESLYYGPPSEESRLPYSDRIGLSWDNTGIFFSGRNIGELIFMSSTESGRQERIPAEGSQSPKAISFGMSDKLYLLSNGSIRLYTINSQSAVEEWALYE